MVVSDPWVTLRHRCRCTVHRRTPASHRTSSGHHQEPCEHAHAVRRHAGVPAGPVRVEERVGVEPGQRPTDQRVRDVHRRRHQPDPHPPRGGPALRRPHQPVHQHRDRHHPVHDQVDPRLEVAEVGVAQQQVEDHPDEHEVDDRRTAPPGVQVTRRAARQQHRADDEHPAAEEVREVREVAEEVDDRVAVRDRHAQLGGHGGERQRRDDQPEDDGDAAAPHEANSSHSSGSGAATLLRPADPRRGHASPARRLGVGQLDRPGRRDLPPLLPQGAARARGPDAAARPRHHRARDVDRPRGVDRPRDHAGPLGRRLGRPGAVDRVDGARRRRQLADVLHRAEHRARARPARPADRRRGVRRPAPPGDVRRTRRSSPPTRGGTGRSTRTGSASETWRDPFVFRDPDGDGWHMLVTARLRDADGTTTGRSPTPARRTSCPGRCSRR